jgi:hypothetical protein
MYECHHGNVPLYARKLWAWDDGDSIPETAEITWPTSLYISDVYQLDNSHPATCFLRSCLCGKPEENGLGAMLLYRGGAAVISSSRISWGSSADIGGIPYHFYERLLRDTTMTSGIIGNAYDIARTDFMDNSGFWLPAYHYNLFGDPATRQFGQLVNIEENNTGTPISMFSVFPNPSHGIVTIEMQSLNTNPIEIRIFDITGRLLRNLQLNRATPENVVLEVRLPAGVYFITCLNSDKIYREKITIVE